MKIGARLFFYPAKLNFSYIIRVECFLSYKPFFLPTVFSSVFMEKIVLIETVVKVLYYILYPQFVNGTEVTF